MYARVTATQVPIDNVDDSISIAREHIVPSARQQKGYKGFVMLVDRGTGKGITITLWESEADCRGTGPDTRYYGESIARVVPLLSEAPTVQDLEVVIQE